MSKRKQLINFKESKKKPKPSRPKHVCSRNKACALSYKRDVTRDAISSILMNGKLFRWGRCFWETRVVDIIADYTQGGIEAHRLSHNTFEYIGGFVTITRERIKGSATYSYEYRALIDGTYNRIKLSARKFGSKFPTPDILSDLFYSKIILSAPFINKANHECDVVLDIPQDDTDSDIEGDSEVICMEKTWYEAMMKEFEQIRLLDIKILQEDFAKEALVQDISSHFIIDLKDTPIVRSSMFDWCQLFPGQMSSFQVDFGKKEVDIRMPSYGVIEYQTESLHIRRERSIDGSEYAYSYFCLVDWCRYTFKIDVDIFLPDTSIYNYFDMNFIEGDPLANSMRISIPINQWASETVYIKSAQYDRFLDALTTIKSIDIQIKKGEFDRRCLLETHCDSRTDEYVRPLILRDNEINSLLCVSLLQDLAHLVMDYNRDIEVQTEKDGYVLYRYSGRFLSVSLHTTNLFIYSLSFGAMRVSYFRSDKMIEFCKEDAYRAFPMEDVDLTFINETRSCGNGRLLTIIHVSGMVRFEVSSQRTGSVALRIDMEPEYYRAMIEEFKWIQKLDSLVIREMC